MKYQTRNHSILFLDTNILLGFYSYSKDDLAKLNQLEDLIVDTKDIKLIVTSQQVDEFIVTVT